MKTKTYLELEEIGIVGMYQDGELLTIITKGGDVWRYFANDKYFYHIDNLMK